MRIALLQIDKTQDSYISEGTEVYSRRLKNYTAFETITINMPKAVRQRSVGEQKKEESRQILGHLESDDCLVVLDENGKELSSVGFAAFIGARQNASVKRLVFLIGGPFGFDDAVYKRAAYTLSLSRMTFSHQMVRLFFVEQLYRAHTILKGEKYHHQ
jgi:23S rRNA (pseudouridine1915-N3)-methyltransferase